MKIVSMLRTIFDTHWPIRNTLMEFLCPSELMDLCIATRTYLSKQEKVRYMNPLREIFYSLAWTDKLISEFSDIALLGKDLCKLSDSRQTGLNLWFLTYRSQESSDFVNIPDRDSFTPQLLNQLRSICNVQYVRPEVNVISITTPEPDLRTSNKRLNLITGVMDTRRTFIFSLNSLPYIANESDDVDKSKELHNFRHVRLRQHTDILVHIPFILYTKCIDIRSNTRIVTRYAVEELKLTKFNFRRCNVCRDTIYTSVSVDMDHWPIHSTIGGLDIQWRIWYTQFACDDRTAWYHKSIVNTTQFDTL